MGFHALICLQLALVGVLFSTIVDPVAAQPKLDCHSCGNRSIPFPFGVGDGCYLNSDFNITCNLSTNPPKPYLGDSNIEVIEINIDGQLNTLGYVAQECYDPSGNSSANWIFDRNFTLSKFTISSKNKFTVIGCDSYAAIWGNRSQDKPYMAGCITTCEKSEYVDDQSCSGSGCCQIEIPYGLYDISIYSYSFDNLTNVFNFSPCTYAFVVDESKFNFSRDYLNISYDATFPLALEWSVDEKNTSIAKACKGNATSYVPDGLLGFRCRCREGYEGNPYLGCYDIDECKNKTSNDCTQSCTNVIGNYTCSCPKWYKGDGRKSGQGCALQPFPIILIISCVGGTFIVAFMASSWLYLVLKHKRHMKLKERFFRENGGFILQQKLSGQEGSSNSFRIFTAEQLEKATDNYDESMIIGKGGFGTVYKGVLNDKREVAIKKSTTIDHIQVEQFVNEVCVLSQINHRNVVKLLGCCLETQAPLLVYEFISNGTLFEHIHQKEKSTTLPWEKRLKVATETAGALTYLHSAASVPIIHRDVKTTNILLGPSYTAKVSDFGASRFVPLDEIQISTMVQGTLGYLDPEYLLTSQLTDKSDVYSFGVVLVELLTGLTPLSFERPEAQRSLAMHFFLSVKHDSLFDILDSDLLHQGKDEQLKEVALLAKKCLELKGEKRPSMKEVAMELEGLLLMVNHPWDQVNSEEEEHLLMEHSKTYGPGDGGSSSTAEYDSIKDSERLSVGR